MPDRWERVPRGTRQNSEAESLQTLLETGFGLYLFATRLK